MKHTLTKLKPGDLKVGDVIVGVEGECPAVGPMSYTFTVEREGPMTFEGVVIIVNDRTQLLEITYPFNEQLTAEDLRGKRVLVTVLEGQ